MEMADLYHPRYWELFKELDIPLDSQGPDELFVFSEPFLAQESRILDVGCRDARHLARLVTDWGGTGVGIDPVEWHVARARAAVTQLQLDDVITIHQAVAEAIPEADASFDVVWCRDVLEVLPNLNSAVAEFCRVLRPGGHLIAYTNILNGQPDERETEQIHHPLGNVVKNLDAVFLESVFDKHLLRTAKKVVVGTRWREFLEERDQLASRDLLRLARLRRDRGRVVEMYGQATFDTAQASNGRCCNFSVGSF